MPGENHAAFTSEIRGRNQRIAMPAHCQMLLFVQKHFDGIGQGLRRRSRNRSP